MTEITKPLVDPDKIVRDVFDTDNIRAKTELSSLQIEAVNKATTLSEMYGSSLLKFHLNDFLVLNKSKDRKSMSEFVESLRSKKNELMEKIGKGFNFMG